MARQPLGKHLVIGGGRGGHERHAKLLEIVPALQKIVTDQCDVLDAFAIELAQEFLDLALAAFAFLIERDADLAVGRGQRFRGQSGVFALDVEEADFAEVEERFVIVRPIFHAAVVDVVREVIDHVEPGADGKLLHAVEIFEIDIVDRQAVAVVIGIAIDQVNDRAADAADRRDPQFHRTGFDRDRLGPALEQFVIGLLRIADAEAHAAGGGAVLAGEEPCRAARFVVQDQVDLPLPPEIDILRAVRCDVGKPHGLENRFDDAFFGGAEFDEFEAVEADGVFKQVGH